MTANDARLESTRLESTRLEPVPGDLVQIGTRAIRVSVSGNTLRPLASPTAAACCCCCCSCKRTN
jgi:hypothetical protein